MSLGRHYEEVVIRLIGRKYEANCTGLRCSRGVNCSHGELREITACSLCSLEWIHRLIEEIVQTRWQMQCQYRGGPGARRAEMGMSPLAQEK